MISLRIDVREPHKILEYRIEGDDGKFFRRAVTPGQDISDAPTEVQELARVLWTDEVRTKFETDREAERPIPIPEAPATVATLQAELAAIRAKLANAETEISNIKDRSNAVVSNPIDASPVEPDPNSGSRP